MDDLTKVLRTGARLDKMYSDAYKGGLESHFSVMVVVLAITAILGLFLCSVANAEIRPADAHRAIIGEASGEGYRGMLAVACAIRNRGTLRGVYGLKAKHVDSEPKWVWDLARKAWRESAKKDIVNGADHWESIDWPVPDWAKEKKVVKQIGKHIFYL